MNAKIQFSRDVAQIDLAFIYFFLITHGFLISSVKPKKQHTHSYEAHHEKTCFAYAKTKANYSCFHLLLLPKSVNMAIISHGDDSK